MLNANLSAFVSCLCFQLSRHTICWAGAKSLLSDLADAWEGANECERHGTMLKAIEKEEELIHTRLYDTKLNVPVQANCANFPSPLQQI